MTQRIPQAAALGLLAWWCLAIARRRETWLRRERVRATAAESAADGIPRVAEGVDPDPYPRAVLPVPVEVIAGAVLVFAAVAVVKGRPHRPIGPQHCAGDVYSSDGTHLRWVAASHRSRHGRGMPRGTGARITPWQRRATAVER
ncbi:MAG: hypothetical protein IPN45_08110 [Actinomycetales bacterium]|nr:hypothetical protein [Actinomycetales bacterium]